MKDELIERLHGAELFLRNIAKAKPAPLNGYDKEILLDISEYICEAIEEIHRLKKDASDIDEFARGICRERTLNGKAIADFDDLQEYIRKEKSKSIKDFADRLKDNTVPAQISKNEYRIISEQGIDYFLKEMTGEG